MENNNKEKIDNKKEVKIKLRTIIIIGIVIVLITVGIVVFINVLRNDDSSTNNNFTKIRMHKINSDNIYGPSRTNI